MNKLFIILGILVTVLVAGFTFKWPAVTQGWPILILLMCPLMHLFMGHDHGAKHSSSSQNSKNKHIN